MTRAGVKLGSLETAGVSPASPKATKEKAGETPAVPGNSRTR